MARNDKSITNVAMLGGVGVPPLWVDAANILLEKADADATEKALQNNEELLKKIINEGGIDKWHKDYTYKYLSSFFKQNPLDDILKSSSECYLFIQYNGNNFFRLSQEVMVAALQSRGRNVVVHRAFHFDNNANDYEGEFGRIVDWFLNRNP